MLRNTQSRNPPAYHPSGSASPSSILRDQHRQRIPATRLARPVWWLDGFEWALDKDVPLSVPQIVEELPVPPFPPSAHISPAMLDQVPSTAAVPAVDGAEEAFYDLSPSTPRDGATVCSISDDITWAPLQFSVSSLPIVNHGLIVQNPLLTSMRGPVEAATHAIVPFPGPHCAAGPGQNSTISAPIHQSATSGAIGHPTAPEMQSARPPSATTHASPLFEVPDPSTTQFSECNFGRTLYPSDEMVSQQHLMQQPPTGLNSSLIPTRLFEVQSLSTTESRNSPLIPTGSFDAHLLSRTTSPRDVRAKGILYPTQVTAPYQLAPPDIQTKEYQRPTKAHSSNRQQQQTRRHRRPSESRGQFLQQAAASRPYRRKLIEN